MNRSGCWRSGWAAVAIVLGAAGCVHEMSRQEILQGPLGYLQPGKTTRREVLLKLGVPTAQFEGERILTYRVAHDGNGGVVTVPRDILRTPHDETLRPNWNGSHFSLVLVFDERGVLAEQSLVPVGWPG